jgi:hypothetical protein
MLVTLSEVEQRSASAQLGVVSTRVISAGVARQASIRRGVVLLPGPAPPATPACAPNVRNAFVTRTSDDVITSTLTLIEQVQLVANPSGTSVSVAKAGAGSKSGAPEQRVVGKYAKGGSE